jgi:hypothetical protein
MAFTVYPIEYKVRMVLQECVLPQASETELLLKFEKSALFGRHFIVVFFWRPETIEVPLCWGGYFHGVVSDPPRNLQVRSLDAVEMINT